MSYIPCVTQRTDSITDFTHLVSMLYSNRNQMKDENESLAELVEALKNLSNTMNSTKRALEAQVKVNEGKFRSVEEALVQRSIEDGIIANFHNASESQLEIVFRERPKFFKYYDEAYKDPEFFKVK